MRPPGAAIRVAHFSQVGPIPRPEEKNEMYMQCSFWADKPGVHVASRTHSSKPEILILEFGGTGDGTLNVWLSEERAQAVIDSLRAELESRKAAKDSLSPIAVSSQL